MECVKRVFFGGLMLLVGSAAGAQGLLMWEDGEGSLKFLLEERARWEIRRDADFKEDIEDSNAFVGNRLRAGLDLQLGTAFRAFAEGQDSRHWGADAAAAKISGRYSDLRQAYVEVRGLGGVGGLSTRLGRQELAYGEERLVGAFGWSNVGRSFDAAKARYESERLFVDAFLARARRRPLLPDTSEQTLSGLYAGFLQDREDLKVEAYALLKRDGGLAAGELGGLSRSRIPTYGGRLLWAPGAGLRMALEAAWQTGERGPDRHRADAQSLRVTWILPSEAGISLGAEWNRASGDEDPTDGRSGSFDNLFPTNHNKYGLMDYHNWSNLREVKLFGSIQVREGLRLEAEVHDFRLDSPTAPWTAAGGALMGRDLTGASGARVGREVDLSISGGFKTRPSVKWLAGVSHYDPGAFAKAVRGPDPSRLAYLQVALAY
ncbi:MAG: alginate export family protein [Acidobacteriota bacterium]